MFRLFGSTAALGVTAGATGLYGMRSLVSTANCQAGTSTTRPKRNELTTVKDRTVLITGATAGIGAACAWRFAEEGSKLVLVGRRNDRLQLLKKEIETEFPGANVHTVAMSVADVEEVAALPSKLPTEYANVDILVNNAGLALGVTNVQDNVMSDTHKVMATNVMGTIAFTQAFLPGMIDRGFGHIVNMGSCAGLYAYATGSVYNASKFAVAGYTNAARHDLVATPVRVTHIAPGMVGETEFSNVRLGSDEKAAAVYSGIEALCPDDIADNVLYAVSRPRNVQIAEILVYATNQSGPRDVARVGPTLGHKE